MLHAAPNLGHAPSLAFGAPRLTAADDRLGEMQGIGQHCLRLRGMPCRNRFAGFSRYCRLRYPLLHSGKRHVKIVDESECVLQAGNRFAVFHHLVVVEQGRKKLARVAQMLQRDAESMGPLRRWPFERLGKSRDGIAVQPCELLFSKPGQIFRKISSIQVLQIAGKQEDGVAVAQLL